MTMYLVTTQAAWWGMGFVMLVMPVPALSQSTEMDVFREAFPQCFKLYSVDSSEHKMCLEVSARYASRAYSDDELSAAVDQEIKRRDGYEQPITRQSNTRDVLQEVFPQCFRLYSEGSVERDTCLSVSALNAHTSYTDKELSSAVEKEIQQRDAAQRELSSAVEKKLQRRDAAKREHEYWRAKEERRQQAQAKEAARKREQRLTDLARKPLGWHLDEWRLGGFGTIFTARITLQNNSASRIADFRIVCSTYGNSGTQLSNPSGVLYEALAAGQRKSFEVNLGLTHAQSARADCAVKNI